jgi:hypothetical protein
VRPSGEQVDVEQIMRDIRARISQRHGIELSTQQIQDLAARRLEAILDPRTVNPSLLEQLRKSAAVTPEPLPPPEPDRAFEEAAIYDSHRPVMRFVRRLLNPLLKLFFNPSPLVHAVRLQNEAARAAAARVAEHERRQTEWNALHYQILQRLVTEVSRTSLEMQALTTRVESLSARVDFNDRRVRGLETPSAASRPQRPLEIQPVAERAAAAAPVGAEPSTTAPTPSTPDGPRRRRRRRRGRRGAASPSIESGSIESAASTAIELDQSDDVDESDDADGNDTAVEFHVSAAEALVPVAEIDRVAVAPEPPPSAEQPVVLRQPTPPPDEPSPAATPEPSEPGPPDR